jgi:hypothetical protein
VKPNVTVNSISIEVGKLDHIKTLRRKAKQQNPSSDGTVLSLNTDNQIIVKMEGWQ